MPEPVRIPYRNVDAWRGLCSRPGLIMSRQIACLRQALAVAVGRIDNSYAALLRLIGKRDGYLACFVREGSNGVLSSRWFR